MTRILRCLISFTTTFTLSAAIHYLLPKPTPSREVDRTQLAMVPPVPGPILVAIPSPTPIVNSVSQISQEEVISFPQIGAVRVSAHEGKGLELTFVDEKSGENLLTCYLGSYRWNWSDNPAYAESNPKLRFKAISVEGLPNPLVIGIALDPGVSDSAWEAAAVGVVNGQLERLNWETLESSNGGGFFFGDLGHGLGLGAAQWDFVWGEDEGHIGLHKYEIKLLKWNGRRFEWLKVFRTRGEYEIGEDALRANGYHFIDIKGTFPDLALDSP